MIRVRLGAASNPIHVEDGEPIGFGEEIEGIPRTGELMGTVEEVRYIHAEDGKAYKHTFADPPSLYAMPDGSLHIWHPVHRLWGDY